MADSAEQERKKQARVITAIAVLAIAGSLTTCSVSAVHDSISGGMLVFYFVVIVAALFVFMFNIDDCFGDWRLRPTVERTHLRGARASASENYLADLDKKFPNRSRDALLAGLPYPPGNERMHTAISASTGAGKTTALMGLLASIRARGDRAIVLDNNGEFMRSFRQPGDLVMSAFEDDAPGWRIANEVRRPYDWDRLADSFVPQGSDNAAEWHGMAKSLFAAVGSGFAEVMDGSFPNSEFQRLLTAADARELAPLVHGSTAEVLAGEDENNARLLQSVRMSFIEHLKAWRYVKDGDFSFRDWIASDSPEWMFLPYTDYEMKLARDLLAGWVDIIVTSALDRPDSKPPARTTWVIIDELNSLGEIAALIVGTTRLRKVGIAIVIAVQDFAQLRETYGHNRAETLMNNFSNKLILRTTEANAAEYLSLQLGEREMYEDAQSVSLEGANRTRAIVTARLVMPAEIQKLPDLEGYLDFAGEWPVIKIKVPLPDRPKEAASSATSPTVKTEAPRQPSPPPKAKATKENKTPADGDAGR